MPKTTTTCLPKQKETAPRFVNTEDFGPKCMLRFASAMDILSTLQSDDVEELEVDNNSKVKIHLIRINDFYRVEDVE